MTDQEHRSRDAASKAAEKEIIRHVRAKAADLSLDERKDVVQDALLAWLNDKGDPTACARRALSASLTKRNRQAALRADRPDDVRRGSLGHDPGKTQESFQKDEEDGLKAAVRNICIASYRASWGKEWNPTKAGLVRKLAAQVDGGHVALERAAREIVKDVLPMLESAYAQARRFPLKLVEVPVTDRFSIRYQEGGGGPFVRALGRSNVLMGKLIALLREPGASLLCESELRRFVARASTNQHTMAALGCTRKDPQVPNRTVARSPNVDEITVIWLLSGGWPEIRRWPAEGISAKNLINRRMKPTVKEAVEAALETHPIKAVK